MPDRDPEHLDLPDGDAVLYPAFFGRADADRLLRELLDTTVWRQDSTTIYGRSVDLTHGSLLVMRGATQHNWVHQIPKTAKDVTERLNLTFRVIKKPI